MNEKVDIYAAGLILFELCLSFKTQHERNQKINQLRNFRKIPKELSENFRVEADIISCMTELKPEKRPSASELLKSELLKHWTLDVQYD